MFLGSWQGFLCRPVGMEGKINFEACMWFKLRILENDIYETN